MNWQQLLIKKAITERIPFANTLRRVKRKYSGYPPNPSNIYSTIKNFEAIKLAAKHSNKSFKDSVVLEIGSGWFPCIPMLLTLEGANRVLMSDLVPHMDEITQRETLNFLQKNVLSKEDTERLSDFSVLPISYLAPFDINQVEDDSLDFIISRAVLEHVPKDDITPLFATLKSKLKKSSVMIHLIDHSDHFEHHDKSLSRIHFLTWSKRKHAIINYLIKDGENRLRHHEYGPLFEAAGYEVIDEVTEVDANALSAAKTLNVAPPFDEMTAEQLSIMTSIYVLRAI